MSRLVDLTGQRFGRLTVIQLAYIKNRLSYWNCICDCGNNKITSAIHLKDGHTQSCGCLNVEKIRERCLKHGLSHKRIHNIWCGMKARCYNPNVKAYPNYGGRGIIVCNEWLHDAKSFCDWATDNGYEDTKSIDRINVNGNYCPENCRWVTWNEQCRNTRQNHLVTLGNKRMCLSDWAHESGISVQTAIKRLQSGWSIEKTLGLQPRKIEVLK